MIYYICNVDALSNMCVIYHEFRREYVKIVLNMFYK